MADLTGYLGFSFGEGQRSSTRYMGGLIDRPLQKAFSRGTSAEWAADCVVYTAQFDLGKKLPPEETQKKAILKYFKDQGITALKTTVKEEADAEEMGHPIRAISVQLPLEDLEKARKAIQNIDVACNGNLARRLAKIQKPKPSV